MNDFNVSRAVASVGINQNLRLIEYYKVLFGKMHETGAWVTISHVPNFESVLLVHWRATPYWGEDKTLCVDAFENANLDEGWKRALASAKAAFEAGPPEGAILDKAVVSYGKWQQMLKDRASKGGKAKAAKDKALRADLIEAQRIAEKFYFKKIPDYNPRDWTFGADDDFGYTRYVLFRNGTENEVGVEVAHCWDEGKDPSAVYRIKRYWHSNADKDSVILEDVVCKIPETSNAEADNERAAKVASRVALTDPKFWLLNDVAKFLD